MATARQQLCKYATVLESLVGSSLRPTMEVLLEAVFSMLSALRLYHLTDQVELVSAVQWSGVSWLVSERVTGLLQFSPYELLLFEADSLGTAIVQEPRVR
jgi:hypothetical protein